MTDYIEHAAEVMCMGLPVKPDAEDVPLPCLSCLQAAEALWDAGRLSMPDHDRQVAARALREWLATWPNRYVGSPIYEDGMAYAEKIERGETDEDS